MAAYPEGIFPREGDAGALGPGDFMHGDRGVSCTLKAENATQPPLQQYLPGKRLEESPSPAGCSRCNLKM